MKAVGYWVLLAATAVLLSVAGPWLFERALARQFFVGEASISLGADNAMLTDAMVTQVVAFALLSNSIPPQGWVFVPSAQDPSSVVSHYNVHSNHVSVMLTSAVAHVFSGNRARTRLIARIEFTNGAANVRLGFPK